MSKGLFIVFEGGEGSGKSTQADCLLQRLSEAGYQSVLVREPGTTTLGLYLREYLKSKRPLTLESELLLFAAARAQLVAEEVRPALERGITVVADRYTGSTVAYQGFGRGIRRDVIDYLNDYVTGGAGTRHHFPAGRRACGGPGTSWLPAVADGPHARGHCRMLAVPTSTATAASRTKP